MIVVDTGPIVALLNDRDDHHVRCRDFLADVRAGLFTLLETTSADLDRIAEARRVLRRPALGHR